MQYSKMSKLDRNKFDKINWRSATQFETALNATISRNLMPNTAITQDVIDNFGPFIRLHFENRSTEIIRLVINGQALGDNSIQFGEREWYIQPNVAIDIIPSEDNIAFDKIAITNTDVANNTSNDEILWSVSNN